MSKPMLFGILATVEAKKVCGASAILVLRGAGQLITLEVGIHERIAEGDQLHLQVYEYAPASDKETSAARPSPAGERKP